MRVRHVRHRLAPVGESDRGAAETVLTEGGEIAGSPDLLVYVAPVLPQGQPLLTRTVREPLVGSQSREVWRNLDVVEVSAIGRFFHGIVEDSAPEAHSTLAALQQDIVGKLAATNAARRAAVSAPREMWTLAEGYRGIERAGLVIINVRNDAERALAEPLAAEVRRIRKDNAVFTDLADFGEDRLQATVVIADLSDSRDLGLAKAVARVRKTIRAIA